VRGNFGNGIADAAGRVNDDELFTVCASYFAAQNDHMIRARRRCPQNKNTAGGGRRKVVSRIGPSVAGQGPDWLACFPMALPMLIRLSANDAEANPALHATFTPIAQRLRPCRRLTTLMRPSHPVLHFWPLRNQRFFCSRGAPHSGGAIGYAHPLYPFGLGSSFVLGGVEARIRGHQTRRPPQHGFMRFDGWDQQRGVVGTLLVDLVLDHDLVFRLLQLDELAKFVGLASPCE
jgi:hypothetical protein